MAATLKQQDLRVRGALTQSIAALGHAPANADLAARCGCTVEEVEHSLDRLQASHSLLLHPHSHTPWAVHPFALSPGSCWVAAGGRGWWANCLYCAMGIVAAVGLDADIHTRLGGESEPLVVRIHGGRVENSSFLFHLSTPVRQWWDNVIHACATFQPFRSETDIDDWCRRHALPKGAVMTAESLWAFAADWYGDYVAKPWRKRDAAEIKALFARHGLTGDFWTPG